MSDLTGSTLKLICNVPSPLDDEETTYVLANKVKKSGYYDGSQLVMLELCPH